MLLVDSYDGSRRALADLLREDGYTVREARDGAEGLRAAGEQLPELVILDPFPGVAGSLKMLRELRQSGGAEPVPCVVLTSSQDTPDSEWALRAECVAFLEKPCPPAEVLAVVRRILGPPLAAEDSGPAAGSGWRPA